MTTRLLSALLFGTALAFAPPALAGPGHDGGTAYGRPGDPAKITRTVTIVATEIAYDKAALSFKTGETVKFILANKGEQDHELTIGDAAMQAEHSKMMEQMAAMPGMDHGAMGRGDMAMGGHEMHGNSVDTAPGETKELVWQFTKPGTFEFVCNYPGHAEVGMTGTITVQ